MSENGLESAEIVAAFEHLFGAFPTHVIRAPGRVNLIGDHTDYNGLPVLPMAIPREVRIACRARDDDLVRVVSTATEYGPRKFRLSTSPKRYRRGDWGNYVKAAVQTVMQGTGVTRGMDALVDSTIPVAAGLSSSSALVVGVAWAVLTLNEVQVERLALAGALAEGERYVGTRGGGMDQAVGLGAREGHALRIDFDPLVLTYVPVPPQWRFIVAHSLTRAEKSGAAQPIYNQRTRACSDALRRVNAALGESDGSYGVLLAGRSVVELLSGATRWLDPNLLRRFRHVITEAERVEKAASAMAEGDLARFAELMNESHVSLRDDYEVSTRDLDTLVANARGAGAVGARLTGAGFGGCIVALSTAEKEEAVLLGLVQEYYGQRGFGEEAGDLAFAVAPAAGASVERLASDQTDTREQPEQSPG